MRAAARTCPARGTPSRPWGSQLPSAHAGLAPAQSCLAGHRLAGVSVFCRSASSMAGCSFFWDEVQGWSGTA